LIGDEPQISRKNMRILWSKNFRHIMRSGGANRFSGLEYRE
jgi:hypothetical protein